MKAFLLAALILTSAANAIAGGYAECRTLYPDDEDARKACVEGD